MKKTFVMGIVWTAVIACVISFTATVNFLASKNTVNRIDNSYTKDEENINEQVASYLTNQSSIRTNPLASLDNNEIASKINDKKDVVENNMKNQMKNEEEIDAEELNSMEDINSVESLNSNIKSFIRPVKGEILNPLSTDELVYSKTLKEWNIHKGTDYKAQLGDEVYAIRDGKIKEIGFNYIYGNYIIIEFKDGYEGLYSNITVLDALSVGESLSQGQIIGYIAESFGFEVAEETHLHFELKKNGEYLSI